MMAPKKRSRHVLEGHDRGGHRMRAAAEEAEADEVRHSPLATFLLQNYLLGRLSLPMVVGISALALTEPANHEDLRKLAGLGTDGAYCNNMLRDLMTRMVIFPIEAALLTLRVPVILNHHLETVDMSMLYPHVLFAKLYNCYPLEFSKRFYGNAIGSIREFWDAQSDHPSYNVHPMRHHEFNHREKGVPLFMHGDDVGAIGIGKVWSKAVNCLSFGGMLGAIGGAFDTHLIIWLLFEHILSKAADGPRTMQTLWRHLVWSLYWLYVGRWPDQDPNGVPYVGGLAGQLAGKELAGGFFGVLWNFKFDLDFGQGNFRLADHSNGLPCFSCPAGCLPGMPWTDCRKETEGNSWIGSVYTNATHAARFGDSLHRLLRCLPGFGIANFIPDVLHVKWLGAVQYFIGGALALLPHYHMPGDPKENLIPVVAAIKLAYDAETVVFKDRCPTLRVSQYKSQKQMCCRN